MNWWEVVSIYDLHVTKKQDDKIIIRQFLLQKKPLGEIIFLNYYKCSLLKRNATAWSDQHAFQEKTLKPFLKPIYSGVSEVRNFPKASHKHNSLQTKQQQVSTTLFLLLKASVYIELHPLLNLNSGWHYSKLIINTVHAPCSDVKVSHHFTLFCYVWGKLNASLIFE